MASRGLKHIEIWSNCEAAAGTRLAIVNDCLSASDYQTLDGVATARFELRHAADSWASIVERRVLRVVFNDGSWAEWRIVATKQERTDDGIHAVVDCEAIKYDLAQGMVVRTEANGAVNPFFELYGLAPGEHMAVALSGAPTYFAEGSSTGGAGTTIDVTYDWDTPLSALNEVCQLSALELDVVPGSTSYIVNLSTRIGSTAELIHVRYARNMFGVNRDSDARSQMVTRIYPQGGGDYGDRLTIGDATWKVASVSSANITLSATDGEPVRFANQFNALWVEEPGGTVTQISDSSTGLGLVLASAAHNIVAGERIVFRGSGAGAELIYLDHPVTKVTYGTVVQKYDRADIPPINNLLTNPYLGGALSTAGVPAGWTKVGTPVNTASTLQPYFRYGTQSLHINSSSSGWGVETSPVIITPSSDNPYYTAQIALLVKSGTVRMELVDVSSTQGGLYPPVGSEPAITSVNDVWVENLAVAGIDLNQVTSTGAKVRVVAYSTGGAEWYLDAAQLTQTAGGAETFYGGRASNDLWLAANEYLVTYGYPYVSFDVAMADLERLNTGIGLEPLVLGGSVVVVDDDMGFDLETRIIGIRRDLIHEAVASLTLSNRPEDLSGLGVPGRRERKHTRFVGSAYRRPTIAVARSTASSTGVTFDVTARSDGQLVAIYQTQYNSSLSSTGYTRAPVSGWKESGYTIQVAVQRPTGDSLRALECYAIDKRGSRSDQFVTMVDASPLADMLTVGLAVNEVDGSAKIAVRADADATHVRVAWIAGLPGAGLLWPAEAALATASTANGRKRALAGSSTLSWATAAGTVKVGQVMRLLTAAYPSASALYTNHGAMLLATDIRGERVPCLLETNSSEGLAVATHGVKVIDPSTWQAKKLYARYKSGTAAPSAWALKGSRAAGTLTNNSTYAQEVTLVEKHQSYVEWRLLYDTNDSTGFPVNLSSPGFDKGTIPDVALVLDVTKTGKVNVVWQGDFDTKSVKIAASAVGNPAAATIRAAAAKNGRVGSSTNIIALTENQKAYIGLFGYSSTGGGGLESSTAFYDSVVYHIRRDGVPTLKEDGSTENAGTAGHAVRVYDPSTWMAKRLYYRTKNGTGNPSAWGIVDSRSTGALTNGNRYSRTVSLEEKHQSFIEWRLLYNNETSTGQAVMVLSPGFDRGNIPNVAITCNLSTAGVLSASWQGDYDTNSVKVIGKSSGNPTIAAIRAAAASNGRVGTKVSLVTLSAGQTGYVGCLGYSSTGGGGSESSTAFFTRATYNPAPTVMSLGLGACYALSTNLTKIEFSVTWGVFNSTSAGNTVNIDFMESGIALVQRTGLAIPSTYTTSTGKIEPHTPIAGNAYSARVFVMSTGSKILLSAQTRSMPFVT